MRERDVKVAVAFDGAKQHAKSIGRLDTYGDPSAGAKDAVHFLERLFGVWHMDNAVTADNGIEACIVEGQSLGIALTELGTRYVAPGNLDGLAGKIEPDSRRATLHRHFHQHSWTSANIQCPRTLSNASSIEGRRHGLAREPSEVPLVAGAAGLPSSLLEIVEGGGVIGGLDGHIVLLMPAKHGAV